MQKKIIIYSIIFFILDCISKVIVNNFVSLTESITVINNFFYLTNVHNLGAAWSFFSGQRILLIVVGIAALFFIFRWINDFKNNNKNIWAFSLLISGLLGNLFDRIIYGYVRDFLDFRFGSYNYPVFNLADTFIFCGVIVLILAIIKGEENGSKSNRK